MSPRPSTAYRPMAPTAPRRRPGAVASGNGAGLGSAGLGVGTGSSRIGASIGATAYRGSLHPLTDSRANAQLHAYDSQVKGSFDRIVPVLKRISVAARTRIHCPGPTAGPGRAGF